MPGLRDFQATFVRELLHRDETSPASTLFDQPGFSVYRNTVMSACIEVLAANYPTVRELIGASCFGDAAASFVRKFPPSSGVLAGYGEAFATFLSSFDPVLELEYLPSIAILDRFWAEAHCAADATPLEAADLAGLTPQALSHMQLSPHPAARWRTFDTMPVYTVWRRHRENRCLDEQLDWIGESALLTRPAGSVVWGAISPDAAVFLTSCASGQTFAEAMDTAFANEPGIDPSTWLPGLIHAGAFARPASTPC